MTERSCVFCRHAAMPLNREPCRSCKDNSNWQSNTSTPAPSPDFEVHPVGTARQLEEMRRALLARTPVMVVSKDEGVSMYDPQRRIAQLEQEVAAQQRRLEDMAVEMQKFMDEAQQRR